MSVLVAIGFDAEDTGCYLASEKAPRRIRPAGTCFSGI